MRKSVGIYASLFVAVLLMSFVGCGKATEVSTTEIEGLKSQLADRDRQIKDLRSTMDVKSDSLSRVRSELANRETQLNTRTNDPVPSYTTELLPPSATAGECFARVYVPPTYRTVVDTLLRSEASERVEVIPAKYEWVEERILVKEESKRFEEVSAKYEWREERVLVREAQVVWKRGRGLVEKVDNTTGEIMCLVETPAEYKTVRKQVQVQPATVREVSIPAEYKTVKVKKMVSPPQEKRIPIDAEYQHVTRTVMVADGHMEWRKVICETNLTKDVVYKIQRALQDKGHNPGPIDGIIGPQTHTALKAYQKSNNLASGGLTLETLNKLNVRL